MIRVDDTIRRLINDGGDEALIARHAFLHSRTLGAAARALVGNGETTAEEAIRITRGDDDEELGDGCVRLSRDRAVGKGTTRPYRRRDDRGGPGRACSAPARSEEGRGGHRCVLACQYGGSPDH